MYQMPQPGGGFQPYQQGGYQEGYQVGMPPPGAFANGGFNPYGKFGNGNIQSENDDEYEYVTDDEGDYIEDENGNILTIEEAQSRGLVEPAGDGERGIGKKLLIGGAVLGGLWVLRRQLKKKKKVKKQKPAAASYNQPPPQNIYGPTQQGMYGQSLYGNQRSPGSFGGVAWWIKNNKKLQHKNYNFQYL